MGRLAGSYVDIDTDLSKLEAGLAKARQKLADAAAKGATIPVSVKFDNSFAKKLEGALGGVTAKYLSLAAAGYGVKAIASGLYGAAVAAADYGESLSKAKAAFGPAAGATMVENVNRLADSFGVVKREALDAEVIFAMMGRSAGMAAGEAAKFANVFTEKGLDIQSFHNITNQEAFEKLRAGLAGEVRPLRDIGIFLNAEAEKTEAVAMGISKVKRELTDEEKILVRIKMISDQLDKQGVTGDLARTIGSEKNQLRRLQGDIENMKEEIGRSLLGPLAQGIALARDLGKALGTTFDDQTIKAFGENLQAVIVAMRAVTALTQGEGKAAGQLGPLGGVPGAVQGAHSAMMSPMFAGMSYTPAVMGAIGRTFQGLWQPLTDRALGVKDYTAPHPGIAALDVQGKERQKGLVFPPIAQTMRDLAEIEKQALENEREKRLQFVKDLGVMLKSGVGQVGKALGDAPKMFSRDFLTHRQGELGLAGITGGPLGLLSSQGLLGLRGVAGAARGLMGAYNPDLAERLRSEKWEKEHKPKERFGQSDIMSGESYARELQTGVLNHQAGQAKREESMVSELEKANVALDAIKKGFGGMFMTIGLGMGAIAKGPE